MIDEQHIDDFNNDGYTLIEGFVPDIDLKKLSQKVNTILRWARQGKVTRIRIYEDMPRIFNGLNVAGIEDPFYYIPELAQWITKSNIDSIIATLTGWSGAELELARIHTNGFFKHKGFWHRDATINETKTSITVTVYFRSESGFRIIPASHEYNRPDLSLGDQIQAKHYYDSLEGERKVTASKGDIFLFKSYLLHQPYSTRPRAHLHLRFNKSNKSGYDKSEWAKYRNNDVIDFDANSSTTSSRLRLFFNYCRPNHSHSNIYQAK